MIYKIYENFFLIYFKYNMRSLPIITEHSFNTTILMLKKLTLIQIIRTVNHL